MKKLLLSLLLAFIFSHSITAQTTQVTIGAAGNSETFNDIKLDPSNGATIQVGWITTAAGDKDCYMVKLNAAKQIVWSKTIVNPGNELLYSVIICANGDYVAVGQVYINGLPRAYACRINAGTGALIWSSISSNAPSPNLQGDLFLNVVETTAGNIVAVGANDLLPTPVDGMVVSMNGATGVQNWARTFNEASTVWFETIVQLPNGNLLIGGMSYYGYYKQLILELDETNANVLAQNDYEIGISNPNPSGGNFINTIWSSKCILVNGTAMFSVFLTDGCCGLNNLQAVYSYDQVTKAVSGNIFWHNGFSNIGNFGFFPITATDYIIIQSIGGNHFVSRFTNGSFAYDRQIAGSAGGMYGIDITGNSLLVTGADPANSGDGYTMFSTIDFPVSVSPCQVSDMNTVSTVPNTAFQEANGTPLIDPGVIMTYPAFVTQDYAATVTIICAVICTPPQANIGNAIICEGTNTILDATAAGATSYSWTSTPAGFTSSVANPTVSPTVSTVYHVNIGNGTCSSDNDVTVTVKPKSYTTINQTICEGQSYEGHTTTGTYITTLVAANGCDSIKTLNLTVKPKALLTINQTICEGQNSAGYTTTGVYVDIFVAANGCDSIRTLNLTVKPKSYSTINQSICEGQSYGGHTTSGTYIDILVAANGCDSVRTLNLIVKPKSFTTINQTICEGQSYQGHTTTGTYITTLVAANSCDSVVTLNLTVKPKSLTTISQVICEGQSYQGHTTTGVYITTLVAANGCDSVVTLNLTVNPKSLSTINQSICEGQSYAGYTITGTYVDIFVAANGCDSTRTLNLTVKPKSYSTINQTICEGQSFEGYTTTGTYVNIFIAANGCDSTRTLNLIVKPKSFTTVDQSICQGQSFEGHTTTGVYVTTLVAANGCDSIITLNLTVKPKSFTTVNQSICEGQSFEGHTITGVYITTLTAANGCDSIITLQLTVKSKSYSTTDQTICEGQSYGGHNTTGTFVDILVAANGCDSVRTLNLIVRPKSYSTIGQTICEGQSYGGHNTTGTFVDILIAANGCDSVRTLNLIVKPKSYSTINQTICQGNSYLGYNSSGTYVDMLVAANGCDSIRTLNLVVLPIPITEIVKTICNGQSYAGYTTSGTYRDTLVGSGGCDSIRILQLAVENRLAPNLGPDRALCIGDTIMLYPGIFDHYLWQNGSTGSYFMVNSAGLYSITVNNSCGTITDVINITATDCNINFPNVFTPNNDGNNDVFHILNAFNLKDYQLTIYNRWGEKIFETNDYTSGWDGTYKGVRCDIDTYVWYCSFLSKTQRKMKGFVILLR